MSEPSGAVNEAHGLDKGQNTGYPGEDEKAPARYPPLSYGHHEEGQKGGEEEYSCR